MDIMSVRNSKSPLEVVQNFDLTFCQVWYDGKNVFATHPDHIVQRVGYLQGDYVKLFMAKNEFLKKRLEKYTQRGFEIRFDPAMLEAVANPDKGNYIQLVCKTEVSPRTPDHYKRWAMHKLLQFIVTKHVRETDYSIRERANKNEVKLNIPDFHFGDGDGYDSEDYDFDTKSPLFAFAEKYAAQHDADLAPLTPEEKFYQLASRCVSMIYSVDENESIFDYITHYNSRMENEAQIQRLVRLPIIKPYIQALKNGVKRTGNDMMYGDVTQLFDFHAHKLDRAVGLEFLDGYLDQNKMNLDKNELKCYLPLSECSKYLTLDDLRPFASLSAYKQYLTTRSPQVIAALDASNELGRITDFGLILRDVAVDTNDWGDINRHTMCPFCLRGEPRDGGCQYMTHYHQGAKDIRKLPYCKKSEQVKEVWQKYRTYQAAIPVDEYGPQGLMWCAICGAPCHGHRHFDSQNPGALKAGIQDEQGVDDYGLCPGGGRPEMIARMLAVRAVMLAHRDDPEPDHKAIRREAAIAADEAPRDPSLMARAEAIFAQEAATRRFDNVGLNEYSMAPEGAPLVNNDENNNGINEQPLAPAANLFVGGTKGHTRKRKSSLKRRLYTRKN
jgi:hypothetical protein